MVRPDGSGTFRWHGYELPSPMVNRLILHVGDCKTGTTSIQAALRAAEAESAAPSLFYGARVNHNFLVDPLLDPIDACSADQVFADAARTLAGAKAEVAVISAEMAEFVDPEVLANYLERYLAQWLPGLTVIAYVRPHGARLLSGYAENIKKGDYIGSLPDFLGHLTRRGDLFYAPRFGKWRAVFGDRFILRPFSSADLTAGCVVRDFFNTAFDAPDLRGVPQRENEGLCLEDLAMLRHIHKNWRARTGGKKVPGADAFGWNIPSLLTARPRQQRTALALDVKLAERIATTFSDDAARTDEAFFKGAPLVSAFEQMQKTALPVAQSIEAEHHLSADEIRCLDIFAEVCFRQIEQDAGGFARAMRDLRPCA
ncbi:hypothetical protein [uncultured Roseobacter sp.]|uniref:hypothetical protein n=2 Tax=uncultured Roseobacter sp. TaxID=114847 RepID=UPI00262BA073|nr:hypothetical protein [uncultured Roseobacter sp.]